MTITIEAGQHEEAGADPRRAQGAVDGLGRRATAGTWSSTASTVLVPNSQASSTRGASVSWTSHSGITTLSSTWLVLEDRRRRTTSRGSPGCAARSRAGSTRPAPRRRSASAALSVRVSGSRVISSALSSQDHRGETGTHRITVVAVGGQREPADQRADGEADVEGAAHEGQGAHPLLAGEDVERVRPARRASRRCRPPRARRPWRGTAENPSSHGHTRNSAALDERRRSPRPAWARPGRRTAQRHREHER